MFELIMLAMNNGFFIRKSNNFEWIEFHGMGTKKKQKIAINETTLKVEIESEKGFRFIDFDGERIKHFILTKGAIENFIITGE